MLNILKRKVSAFWWTGNGLEDTGLRFKLKCLLHMTISHVYRIKFKKVHNDKYHKTKS